MANYHSPDATLSEEESIDMFVSPTAAATGTGGAADAAANNGGVDATDDATATDGATITYGAAAATVVVPAPVEDSTPAPVDDEDSTTMKEINAIAPTLSLTILIIIDFFA